MSKEKPSNIYDVYLTSTSGQITCDNPIQKQVIRLKSYRVEFSSDAAALLAKYIKIETPFLSGNGFLSAKTKTDTTYDTTSALVLLLDGTKVTLKTCDIPLFTSDIISESYKYQMHSFSLADLVSVHLVFEYTYGDIV